MNKKLIAVAVASTFAVPAIAQAASHGDGANWYGRINTGISIVDTDDDTTADIKNVSSRFGVRGAEDLGNGLSVVYRYEFGVASDVADVQDNNRLSFVGLRGSFGQVIMGRVWSASFNHVGTIMDPSQNIGGDAYNGAYRVSNVLSYSGNAGPIALQADFELDGDNANSDGADSWNIGGTFSTGALRVAAAYREVNGAPGVDDTEFTGIAAKVDLENLWLGAGWTSTDDGSADEATGVALLAGGRTGDFSWWASVEDLQDDDAGVDSGDININLTRHTSASSQVYAEIAIEDNEDGDVNELLLGLRKDF